MRNVREWLVRLAVSAGRRGHSRDDDLRKELEFHRGMVEDELRRQGLDREEARREAHVRVGGVTQVLESYGDQRSIPFLESLVQDIRYAVRTFRRTPGFTIAALLTLAIGIGATTAIFSVVNTVLLRPLPYGDANRLVVIGEENTFGSSIATVGFGTIAEFRQRTRAFEQIAAIRSWQATLVTTEAERLTGMRVSSNYFSLLGVSPALGRTFTAEDDRPDSWRVLVLSDGLWRRRFNADPNVIGRTIHMEDRAYQVVGVMPPGFEDLIASRFYQKADLWAALGYDVSLPYACRSCRHLRALGVVREGVSLAQARDDLESIRGSLARQYPADYGDEAVSVVRLSNSISGPVREPLLVLSAAAAFVLLIACANVANLLLARGINRGREMAVRLALGAGRARLVRQVVTESTILWLAGGVAGAAFATVAVRLLVAAAPVDLPRASLITIDGRMLVAALFLSVLTGLVFGLIPAFGGTSDSSPRLSRGARGSIGQVSGRLRRALVVADLAIALVLLVGAGLMIRSVERLLVIDPGFRADRVLTANFSLIGQAYREEAAVLAFMDRLIERASAIPGVEAAAVAGQVPMGGNRDSFGVHIEGDPRSGSGSGPSAERYSVTPDYFRVLQIPLRRGRLLASTDTAESEPVMLLSETAARTFFGTADALDRRIRVGGGPGRPWRRVVGIVGDVRHTDLAEDIWPQMYLPQTQFTDSFLVLAIRSATDDASALTTAVRSALREEDPSVPMYGVAPLDELVAKTSATRRFVAWLLTGFAAVSLLLAAVGLYGVISYTVSLRTREVGLRVALGATRGHILRLVFGSGASTILGGVLAGIAVAVPVTSVLRSQLFQVQPLDWPTFASAVGVLALVALAAHVIPIRRALAVDPTHALREE